MPAEVLHTANLKLALEACTAYRKGHAVRLGPIECRMLAVLMRAQGAPVATATLCQALWPALEAPASTARVRGVAKRLRAKLRGLPIETIVREGYRLPLDA